MKDIERAFDIRHNVLHQGLSTTADMVTAIITAQRILGEEMAPATMKFLDVLQTVRRDLSRADNIALKEYMDYVHKNADE